MNGGLDLSVICMCVWLCETRDLPRDISFKDVYSGKYTYNGFFFFY